MSNKLIKTEGLRAINCLTCCYDTNWVMPAGFFRLYRYYVQNKFKKTYAYT